MDDTNLEKPLSPVLNKSSNYKRLADKVNLIRKYGEKKDFKITDTKLAIKTLQGKTENKSSCIPILKQESFEIKHPISSPKHSSEGPSLATPSAVLQFKNEILANCAKLKNSELSRLLPVSDNSSSDGKMKRFPEECAETLNSGEGKSRAKQFKRDTVHVPRNSPVIVETGASGDIRYNFQSPRSNENSVNTLYENKDFYKFNLMSKTSVIGSVATDSNDVYLNETIQSTTCSTLDSPRKRNVKNDDYFGIDDEIIPENCIENSASTSYLNYDNNTDECNIVVGSTNQGENFKLCTQETNQLFENFRQNLKHIEDTFHREGECSSKSTIHVNVTKSFLNISSNDEPFIGFNEDEVKKLEMYYKKYKNKIKSLEPEVVVKPRRKSKRHSNSPDINNKEIAVSTDKTILENENLSAINSTANFIINKKIKSSLKLQSSPIKCTSNESSNTTFNNPSISIPNIISLPANNKVQIHVKNCHIEISVRNAMEKNNNDFIEKQNTKVKDIENKNIRARIPYNNSTSSPRKPDNISYAEKLSIKEHDYKSSQFEISAENTNNHPTSFGFTSASGKAIQISTKHLEKTKKLFEEDLIGDGCKLSKNDKFGMGPTEKVTNNSACCFGFASASGKSIQISDKYLGKAQKLFQENSIGDGCKEEISKNDEIQSTNKEKTSSNFMFARASGKEVKISDNRLEKAQKLFQEKSIGDGCDAFSKNDIFEVESTNKIETSNSVPNFEFASASGKTVQISQKHLGKAQKLFQDNSIGDGSNHDTKNEPKNDNLNKKATTSSNVSTFKFASASGKTVEISEKHLESAQKHFQEDLLESGYERNSKNTVSKSGNHLHKSSIPSRKSLQFNDTNCKSMKKTSDQNIKDSCGLTVNSGAFSCASGRSVNISLEMLKKKSNLFADIQIEPEVNISKLEKLENCKDDEEKTTSELIEDVVNSYDSAIGKFKSSPMFKIKKDKSPTKTFLNRSGSSKKRLGMGMSNTTTSFSKEKLDRAKMLFEDIDIKYESNNFDSIKSPLKSNDLLNNTPIKMTSISTNQQNKFYENTSTPKAKLTNMSLTDLTPIKNIEKNVESDSSESTIIFHEKSCSSFEQLQSDIEKEYFTLKRKLNLLEERKIALENQKNIIANGSDNQRRQTTGILTNNKQKDSEQRVPLRNLCFYSVKNIDYFNIDQHIFEITPKNAEKIHFNVSCSEKALITTLDGAVIIPNSRNSVGLTEIENAFQAMRGVDPKLIPKHWVQNHYKWIVWKLASYERKFPQYFKNCLNIENIIQQLKYRYEKEIDNALRPCLRRIFEKDDIPQKRLVLCVSDITQLYTNKFELQLTDGWYEIRAAIDAPLCQQIYRGRIKVGTKLIMYGAELINFQDGCHPLQAPDNMRLKISYNSTRRANWHVKLGYYKNPSPFPIELKSIHKDGGSIGLIKIYIARVYPLKYFEDHNGAKIWRNGKAEEKRAKEFEAENNKMLENLKYAVLSEYEQAKEEEKKSSKKNSIANVQSIVCGETLYNLIEKSNDPDSLFGSLSPSQQKSVIEYKQSETLQRHFDIKNKLSKKVEELKMDKRKVTPVLKMCVNDVTNCDITYILNYWNPTEEVIQMLKEESSFYFYNLIIRKSGELYSTNRTFFKENTVPPVFKKLQRQLLPIAMTVDNYYKPLFNEFDTVGMVVETKINNYDQELWLSDFVGGLLCVKIPEGPKMCSLLDNLKRGQTIALSNLIMQIPNEDYGKAIANQCSVISQYPQQAFLQGGLEMFNQQLPEDLNSLLINCDIKIEQIRKKGEVKYNTNNSVKVSTSSYNYLLNDSLDDNSSLPSRLTPTDIAMSLLDTDQFF